MAKQRPLTEVSYIKDLCSRYGFNLSKGFGQNFLINPGICPKMADAAGLCKNWGALEIGPGIGVLTRELSAAAGKVVSVELDTRLFPLLSETLEEQKNVTLVEGDALKIDIAEILEKEFAGMPVALCANLPYYITSPIIARLLESRLSLETIVVMVQKEFAQRITAEEGTRLCGAITLMVHYYAKAEKLFDVQPGSFFPPPKVTSSVVRLTPHAAPPVQPESEKALFALIKAAFSMRRKTAANAISAGLGMPKGQVEAALLAVGRPDKTRPEELTLKDYAALTHLLKN